MDTYTPVITEVDGVVVVDWPEDVPSVAMITRELFLGMVEQINEAHKVRG